jgi:hypothetical protein
VGTAAPTATTSLPYAVDNDFFAAGYEGDTGSIVQTGDTTGTACVTRAPGTPIPNAQCWKVTYTVPIPPAVTMNFAGVEWQANLQQMMTTTVPPVTYYNNFGVAPGVVPPAGANQVSFWAKGAAGGEVVTFSVGAPVTPCMDSVTGSTMVTLTTTWTEYSIPITGSYTNGQIDGFGWSSAGSATAPTTFFIDDIAWDIGGG